MMKTIAASLCLAGLIWSTTAVPAGAREPPRLSEQRGIKNPNTERMLDRHTERGSDGRTNEGGRSTKFDTGKNGPSLFHRNSYRIRSNYRGD